MSDLNEYEEEYAEEEYAEEEYAEEEYAEEEYPQKQKRHQSKVDPEYWDDWPNEDIASSSESFLTLEPKNFNLFDIKKTQIEMMIDRGFEVEDYEKDILNMTQEQFDEYHNQLLQIYEEKQYHRHDYFDLIKDLGSGFEMSAKIRLVLGNTYFKKEGDVEERCFLIYLGLGGNSTISNKIIGTILKIVDINLWRSQNEKKKKKSSSGTDFRKAYENLIIIAEGSLSPKANEDLDGLRITRKWLFNEEELVFNITKHFMTPKHEILSKEKTKEFKQAFKAPQQISICDPVVKYYGWDVGNIVSIVRDTENMGMFTDEMMNKRIIVRKNAV